MDFNPIRAYSDEEFPDKLETLISDQQFQRILRSQMPSLPGILGFDNLDDLITELRKITSVDGFQKIMATILAYDIQNHTDGVTYSGLERAPKDDGVLFLSNHRLISLDPAYINYVLHQAPGYKTLFNACGDNILEIPWLDILVRINKGFVVKRDPNNEMDVDVMLEETTRLSQYIDSLVQDNQYVWIAHRNGRAYDGLDKTDPAVIQMLCEYAGEKRPYSKWTDQVDVRPVSISWEIIPCDYKLAQTLAGDPPHTEGHKDLNDIVTEIQSHKGRVHIAFGERVKGNNRKEVVAALDEQIQTNYKLWDANWLAYVELSKDKLSESDKNLILANIDQAHAQGILDRVLRLQDKSNFEDIKQEFYKMYANPVESALKYVKNSVERLIQQQNALFDEQQIKDVKLATYQRQ